MDISLRNDYQVEVANDLLSSVILLSSFDGVERWDKCAQQEITKINAAKNNIVKNLQQLQNDLTDEQAKINQLSFFKKLFASRTQVNKIEKEIIFNNNFISEIQLIEEELEQWIDRTPDNPAQAKELIKELKLIKKELSVQKKELNVKIREINANARMKNAEISNQLFIRSKYKQIVRIGVRAEKEATLRPNETERQMIDRKIIEIEKMINWIEKICSNTVQ
jgi:hypothetical protein